MTLNEGLETLGTDEYTEDGKMYYGVFQESALVNVRLPSTLRRIEYYAFQNCRKLKGTTLPKKLERQPPEAPPETTPDENTEGKEGEIQ